MPEDESPSTAISESGSAEISSTAARSDGAPQRSTLPEGATCPSCSQEYRSGALICPSCGAIVAVAVDLLSPEATYNFTAELSGKSRKADAQPKIGSAPLTPAAIVLVIDGTSVSVPSADVVIVGRSGPGATEEVILDLSPFGGFDKGVSRRHARITRKGTIACIADIGSVNGTWLNGQRLMVDGERLLRNDDELQLGLLKLTVKYEPGIS